MKRNPNRKWFHTIGCSASYNNRKRIERIGPAAYSHLKPQHGNEYGRKYPADMSWYIHRIYSDHRLHVKPILNEQYDKDEMVRVLQQSWNIQNGKCAYSDMPLVKRVQRGRTYICATDNPFEIASVDRIDSSQPYQEGNVQWVSQAMNQAKGDIDDNDFREYYTAFST
jgi:hypothetical protein